MSAWSCPGFSIRKWAVRRPGEWCALARINKQASRQIALASLPCDAYQTMAVIVGNTWVSESLAGLYRVDPASNRVTAKIQIGPPTGRLVTTQLRAGPSGMVLATGVWTQGGVLTRRNGLARIDPNNNHVEGITPLPTGPLLTASGAGSLWVAQVAGSSVERIDPSTGRLISHLQVKVGTALALAGGRLWSADKNGTIRQVA